MGFPILRDIPSVTSLSGSFVGLTVAPFDLKRPTATVSKEMPERIIRQPIPFSAKPKFSVAGYRKLKLHSRPKYHHNQKRVSVYTTSGNLVHIHYQKRTATLDRSTSISLNLIGAAASIH